VAVLIREEQPPNEVKEPVEWLLLTTVPVNSLVDAVERVQWYAKRWGIEVFHRILKSGCLIEDRQLATADRLEACLAIDAVVAWRIHYLTWLGRATPDLPCTVAFDDDQWKAVIVFKTREPPPEQAALAAPDDPLHRPARRLPRPQIRWPAGNPNPVARPPANGRHHRRLSQASAPLTPCRHDPANRAHFTS